ncbi:hypothetical protein [Variovorax sp. HJSM1_2]|uniref:hypothetical protein n=1 Tax=Variovorax sp. HJSM1_2 TaxID=3366263 RepID=UPI003BE1C51E
MEDGRNTPGLAGLPEGRFEGRMAFQQLVREALRQAATEGWREIIVCDPDFEDWPLGEREVIESLNAWAKTGRQWRMLASQYDMLIRRHPRFVSWRQTWGHLIDCRSSRAVEASAMPSCLLAPGWVLRRLDVAHCAGLSSTDAVTRNAQREQLTELMHQSGPAFPASVLGL